MNIILTNDQIYNYANNFIQNFSNKDIKFPVKVNFYLQKNQKILLNLATEIENARISIGQEYGIFDEEKQQYKIPIEKMAEVRKRLDDLFNLTQEVKIYKVKLEDFGNLELTSEQMQTLLFMIEEEEENE